MSNSKSILLTGVTLAALMMLCDGAYAATKTQKCTETDDAISATYYPTCPNGGMCIVELGGGGSVSNGNNPASPTECQNLANDNTPPGCPEVTVSTNPVCPD